MKFDWLAPAPACYEVAMPRSRQPRTVVSLVASLAAALVLACTSPTLPLPPPAVPTITTGIEPDTFRLSSVNGSEPNALIIIVNRNEELPRNKRVSGTIADAQGSWDAVVYAKAGDSLDILQDNGSGTSPATTVVAR